LVPKPKFGCTCAVFSISISYALPIYMMPASTAKWDDLSIESPIDPFQLHKINLELELVLVAIAAITHIDRIEIGQIAQKLQVAPPSADWLAAWSDSQFDQSQSADIEQIKSRVLIVHHLTQQYQLVVRQNLTYWQQIIQFDRLPLESPALAEYIGSFIEIYQIRFDKEITHSFEALSQAALNLLIELLFYSSTSGHRRIWNALLQKSQQAVTPPKPT
jgi:hypothetical protein